MQVYFPRMNTMLFAPSKSMASFYLAQATDLADLERREALLEARRRENLLSQQ